MVVNLEHAFYWKCPSCNEDNFVRGEKLSIENETDIEEARELLIDSGLMEEYEDFSEEYLNEVVAMPLSVSCERCNSKFDSIPEDEDTI